MKKNNFRVLILGANGLLGNNLLNFFQKKNIHTKGLIRDKSKCIINSKNYFFCKNIINKENKITIKVIEKIIQNYKPKLVINCIGITKAKNVSQKMYYLINGKFPKQVSLLSKQYKFKFIHFSTDCVFDGKKGNYKENDKTNACDVYGKSKIEGEKLMGDNIIFRTSMIGHSEIKDNGLLEWFLSQNFKIDGYSKMYFTGPTALEIGKIILNYVIRKKNITDGIYNLGTRKISKYNLLKLFKIIYKKDIKINLSNKINIDRSLNLSKLRKITKYNPPSWIDLLKEQKKFYEKI